MHLVDLETLLLDIKCSHVFIAVVYYEFIYSVKLQRMQLYIFLLQFMTHRSGKCISFYHISA